MVGLGAKALTYVLISRVGGARYQGSLANLGVGGRGQYRFLVRVSNVSSNG